MIGTRWTRLVWSLANANTTEEEPRTSDGDAVDGADEQMSANVQITARPHRRPSPGFDETPNLIKPIPRGSSFFIFSHTNRLAQSANGQTNPISFFLFFFSFFVCVCVRVVRQTTPPPYFGLLWLPLYLANLLYIFFTLYAHRSLSCRSFSLSLLFYIPPCVQLL